jgi:hypothetical protein
MSRWVLLLALVSLSASAERRALLVSNSHGRSDQAPLRYPARDAARLEAVLTELGDFTAPSSVREGSRDDVLGALASLRAAQPFELFVFYFSGHGDAGGLVLGESYLPSLELMEAVARVPAQTRLVVLDACQSGGALRRKGVVLGPPVDVRVEQSQSEGSVLIASSSAEAASFESEALEGAIFTSQLVSGLRGDADDDDDGQVTLSEVYRYASVRTLEATMLAPVGPQRPSFRWDLSGRAEPVLTRKGAAARLTVRSRSGGDYFVFDGLERQLVAELSLRAGQRGRVLLRPGLYVVRERGEREVRTARVGLGAGDDRELNEAKMEPAPLVHLARKGGLGQLSVTAMGGPAATQVGQLFGLQLRLGVELQRSWALWGLELAYFTGSIDASELTFTQRALGVQAVFLPGLEAGRVALRLGPSLGLFGAEQQQTARSSAWGMLGKASLRARVEVQVAQVLWLMLGLEAGGYLGRLDGRVHLALTADAALGVRLEF